MYTNARLKLEQFRVTFTVTSKLNNVLTGWFKLLLKEQKTAQWSLILRLRTPDTTSKIKLVKKWSMHVRQLSDKRVGMCMSDLKDLE